MTKADRHDSMRGYFAYELYQQMAKNKDIWLIVGDLGYKVFDHHFEDFPDRCINAGAAEQAMADIAVGLSYAGRIPFIYSITPFLIYRPFETLRTYINHEKLNVKLVGSGRDSDYEHDGISHNASDVRKIVTEGLPLIHQYWPISKENIPHTLENMVVCKFSDFLSLKR